MGRSRVAGGAAARQRDRPAAVAGRVAAARRGREGNSLVVRRVGVFASVVKRPFDLDVYVSARPSVSDGAVRCVPARVAGFGSHLLEDAASRRVVVAVGSVGLKARAGRVGGRVAEARS